MVYPIPERNCKYDRGGSGQRTDRKLRQQRLTAPHWPWFCSSGDVSYQASHTRLIFATNPDLSTFACAGLDQSNLPRAPKTHTNAASGATSPMVYDMTTCKRSHTAGRACQGSGPPLLAHDTGAFHAGPSTTLKHDENDKVTPHWKYKQHTRCSLRKLTD